MFNYPLTKDELVFFAQNEKLNEAVLEPSLSSLINKKVIYKLGDFYSVDNNISLEERRVLGNKRAQELLSIAQKKSKFIAKFPYVKGVFISGSLSKNYIDEDGDIDYFIITKPNRLWIARTLLVLYKKIFLFNSRKYFCVNYFIDEENLEIPEKNLFTATEIVTILPMVGKELYNDFMIKNSWAFNIYPNATLNNKDLQTNLKKGFLGNTIEFVLNSKLGDIIDGYFMKVTLKRWQKKFKKFTPAEFELVLKTTKRTSKHHPSNFQSKVLNNYETKLKEITERSNLA